MARNWSEGNFLIIIEYFFMIKNKLFKLSSYYLLQKQIILLLLCLFSPVQYYRIWIEPVSVNVWIT